MSVDTKYRIIAPYLPNEGTRGSVMSRMMGWTTKIYMEFAPITLIGFHRFMGVILIRLIAMQMTAVGMKSQR